MRKQDRIITYSFVGINPRGRKIKGEVSEKSTALARTALKKQGITAKSLRAKPNLGFLTNRKIKAIDITIFARQLATMMRSGITLISSFDIVAEGLDNQKMKKLVLDIKADVETGETLANALKKHPLYFDNLFCALVEAGEQSGKTEQMLDRVATYKEKNEMLRLKVKKAMKYPITVIFASLIVTVILLLKVIPVFSDLFSSFGGDLPAFTQLIVDASEFTKNNWVMGLITLVVTYIFISKWFARSVALQHIAQRLSLRAPIVGSLINKAIIARFSSTLATTFAAGVTMVDALESAGKACSNIAYEEVVQDIRADVIDGQQLYFAMKCSCMFPTMAVQMTSIGEESGELEKMLEKVASFYEAEVDTAVDGLTSMLEPLVMCILGILVGGLVVAMYLPIFQMGAVV